MDRKEAILTGNPYVSFVGQYSSDIEDDVKIVRFGQEVEVEVG